MKFVLQLFRNDEGTDEFLCDFRPALACPQWLTSGYRRYTWDTAAEAETFLTSTVRESFSAEFRDADIRVTRI